MTRLARLGHAPDPAAVEACLAATKGVDTLQLVFPDLHGLLRGKTIMGAGLASALANGLGAPATILLKDTSGQTAFPVWAETGAPLQGVGDLILVPDPTSLRHGPGGAMLLCDVVLPDGSPIPFAPRHILRQAVQALAARGLSLTIGLELEFHVFAQAPDGTHTALTAPSQLLSMEAADRCADLLDALRRMAKARDLPLATLETEHGASQFEATFHPGPPEAMAEVAALFRAGVKDLSRRMGLAATFMCKPGPPATAASGWHIHQCLSEGDTNLHAAGDPRADHWIAGLLTHAAGACLLTNPTVNGYRRFAPHSMAPDRIAWGHDTRGAMIRALTDGAASRVENRAPDPAANPWLALAAQIHTGLAGLTAGTLPPPPVTAAYEATADRLPNALGGALQAFRDDPLWQEALGDSTCKVLTGVADSSWARYLATTDTWDRAEYLDLF